MGMEGEKPLSSESKIHADTWHLARKNNFSWQHEFCWKQRSWRNFLNPQPIPTFAESSSNMCSCKEIFFCWFADLQAELISFQCLKVFIEFYQGFYRHAKNSFFCLYCIILCIFISIILDINCRVKVFTLRWTSI